VVPDYVELSPFYQRPNSAPAASVDPTRPIPTSIRSLERQRSDVPHHAPSTEPPLPPIRGSIVRTFRKHPTSNQGIFLIKLL
jgi:hypothetical protein